MVTMCVHSCQKITCTLKYFFTIEVTSQIYFETSKIRNSIPLMMNELKYTVKAGRFQMLDFPLKYYLIVDFQFLIDPNELN